MHEWTCAIDCRVIKIYILTVNYALKGISVCNFAQSLEKLEVEIT